ncbi:L-glutamate gamma-semialdehyde dehydrogenase [Sorangium sp. So ce1036]|uniref:L-glutamate gamma-semialdehyde dehydrogenase n=1 Tax=Sorangium sp. So ce1036 TaxID=3133328 RepID=UPI003F02324A
MIDAIATPPSPQNEPVLAYAPGSPERAALKAELERRARETIEIPMIIDGEAVRTGALEEVRAPHRRDLLLARAHQGGAEHVARAIEAARRAHPAWSRTPWTARAAVFLKAAELLATRYRPVLNAATMLGQSKTAYQAEIDAACELIDFFRYNVHFAHRIAAEQPASAPGMWNLAEPRPLEGFVFAATPFNFTAIAGNLPAAPALMGNTVVWKPSANALYSAHFVMELLTEAGLPRGVINLVMGPPGLVSNACLDHPDFAGIHFTGSTAVFQAIWRRIGENIGRYRGYPRVVGETGGKDFVFAHASADVDALAVALVRGAYEYQGQKCSAASRAYIPRSLWPTLKDRLVGHIQALRVGDVADFRNFMGAVIDGRAHARLTERIAAAKGDPACSLLCGGGGRAHDGSEGWFVEPTLIETTDPRHALMTDELFGPVLTVWVYPDGEEARALALCDETSPYGLTGAVFARDRAFIEAASDALRFAAGNFYINDKPTGAVVGQQPFGGARGSGTNDKAGSMLNLLRWVSPRVVKETFAPPRAVPYPFMAAE